METLENKIENHEKVEESNDYVIERLRVLNEDRINQIENLNDQLLQLKCEHDEKEEERNISQEALETLQNNYDALELEDTQKGMGLRIIDFNNELRTNNEAVIAKKRAYIKEIKVPKRNTTMGYGNPSRRARESIRIKEVIDEIDNMSNEHVNLMYNDLVEPVIDKLQAQIDQLVM